MVHLLKLINLVGLDIFLVFQTLTTPQNVFSLSDCYVWIRVPLHHSQQLSSNNESEAALLDQVLLVHSPLVGGRDEWSSVGAAPPLGFGGPPWWVRRDWQGQSPFTDTSDYLPGTGLCGNQRDGF